MSERQTRRYVVSGLVQGVGFRYFARREARRAGVTGWVRNLPEEAVEAVACGTQEALDDFAASLARGPAGASVTDLRVEEILDDPDELISFVIRY